MNKRHDFIKKYFAAFLTESRIRNLFVEYEKLVKIPPTSQEIEELISVLQKSAVDPVIVGTLAVMKHLVVTTEDIHAHTFRPIQTVDLLVYKKPLQLPHGWEVNTESSPIISWISPSRGYVKFLKSEDEFPANYSQTVGKDRESVEMDCPVADVETLFKMKLNSRRERDLGDLMMLAKKVGIPADIEKKLWNTGQQQNLEFLQHWAKLRIGKKM